MTARDASAPAISLENVSKTFPHRPALFNWLGRERSGVTRALESISLQARNGEVCALLGPNGSGKTTILKLISTMWLPDSGSVTVGGFDTAAHPQKVREQVGFAVATERSFFPRLTARENLELFATLEEVDRRERARQVKQVLEVTALPDVADVLVHKFSSGMFQRLGIARALLKDPRVLLLDEPSRSLDPSSAMQLWRSMRRFAEAGAAVVLATHNFEEASAVADSVAILRQGSLVARRVLQTEATVEDLRNFYFREVEPVAETPRRLAESAREVR